MISITILCHFLTTQKISKQDVLSIFQSSSPALYMEYTANGSICQYIKKEQSSVCEWNATKMETFGVASAMQSLHSHRILNRDLEPENILITKELLPKLSDFGLVNSRFDDL